MQFERVYTFMIRKLEAELPSYIVYHSAAHTLNVLASAEHLAKAEGIEGEDLVLLRTAALFHDAGFLQHHVNHEELSCNLARKYLPEYGYNPAQIDSICAMIMATRLPQTPANHLGQVLCDADLFYLGSDEYSSIAEKLYREFLQTGIVDSRETWDNRQVEFLSAHRFFTQTAIIEREAKKLENLEELQAKIENSVHSKKSVNKLELIQDAFQILLGVVLASFALKGFLVPNRFFDGGITGISLLVHELYHFDLALVIIVLNLPLIVVSYFSVGRRFAYRAFISVILLGLGLTFLPFFTLTSDKLLISIFGGVFLGAGIGLIMRAGAALDGIEVLALYTLKRTSFTITEIILGINILIFTIAAIKFGTSTALYSTLTYFAATRCIDYVVEGIQAYTGVTIISGKSEAIKYQLVNRLGRGITVYKGERGFLPGKFEISAECDIIFTVITRLEMRKLKNLVYEVDPKAFVFASTIKEASGGVLKRRHHH